MKTIDLIIEMITNMKEVGLTPSRICLSNRAYQRVRQEFFPLDNMYVDTSIGGKKEEMIFGLPIKHTELVYIGIE